jgi:ATP-dependent Clp protease adaptor protein ClpS
MQKPLFKPDDKPLQGTSEFFDLVLFNDDVNTFDFVIDCLVDVCRHEPLQAEQCALIAHLKGKCTVKSGSFEELSPINNTLNGLGLSTVLC